MGKAWVIVIVSMAVAIACSSTSSADGSSEAPPEEAVQPVDSLDETDEPDDDGDIATANGDADHSEGDQQSRSDADKAPSELPPDKQPPPYELEYDISEVYAVACVSCHGDKGDGDGAQQEGFGFDTPANEWTNGPTVDGILQTLEDGIHDSAMREFPQFTNQDRVELAEYIIDLRHAAIDD